MVVRSGPGPTTSSAIVTLASPGKRIGDDAYITGYLDVDRADGSRIDRRGGAATARHRCS